MVHREGRLSDLPDAPGWDSRHSRDYPEPETIVSATLAGYRVVEAPVVMRERMGGKSSIDMGKSVYYMVKVSLALVVNRLSGPRRKGRIK